MEQRKVKNGEKSPWVSEDDRCIKRPRYKMVSRDVFEFMERSHGKAGNFRKIFEL